MCLPDFERFENISEDNPLIGYRIWKLPISNPVVLKSEYQDYNWVKNVEGPHVVVKENSGIYAYNNYNNNNNYNKYYYYYYYYVSGIINQYGRVAIHKIGQRSEYAKITKLFTIRESDAKGPSKEEFLGWIKKFNLIITKLSEKYECETIHWQDFKNE